MHHLRVANASASMFSLVWLLGAACAPSSSPGTGQGGNTSTRAGAGSPSGGTSGTGGTSVKGGSGGNGTGGAAGTGGSSSNPGGAGGLAGAGGAAGAGGQGGTGGNASSIGGAAGKGGAGGSMSATGGNLGGNGGTAGAGAAGGAAGKTSGTGGAGASPGSGGKAGSGGTIASGGSTSSAGSGGPGGSTSSAGSGGSASGLCATAFFSADAAGRKSSEYSSWKTSFIQECTSNGSAVVKNGGGVYSEGIGYGMLLAANNNEQALFDKLWKFYTDHLDPNGLMNWSMDACAAPGNNNANAAADGDLDAGLGLAIANKQWGGYQSQAQNLIGKIKQFETDSCSNGLVVLRPGDNWGGCSDPNNKGKVNPSYFSPGHYRVFATIDTANAAFWKQLAADSYTLLAQYQATMNGLVPEWGYNDGRVESSTYDYNACRTPWRVAMDFMWFCTPEAKTFLEKIGSYVDGKGGVTSTGFAKNSAFVGAFADSGIAISQAKIDGYVSSWMTATGMDDTPYFQGTLRRLYLLVAGGQMLSGL